VPQAQLEPQLYPSFLPFSRLRALERQPLVLRQLWRLVHASAEAEAAVVVAPAASRTSEFPCATAVGHPTTA